MEKSLNPLIRKMSDWYGFTVEDRSINSPELLNRKIPAPRFVIRGWENLFYWSSDKTEGEFLNEIVSAQFENGWDAALQQV